jgi:hypothetical protein
MTAMTTPRSRRKYGMRESTEREYGVSSMEYGRYGRAGEMTKGCAKVQIGAELLCKSAKVF